MGHGLEMVCGPFSKEGRNPVKGKNKKRNRSDRFNILYVLPMILVFAVFILYPVLQVVYLSFFNKKVNGEMVFIGLDNYVKFFTSQDTLMVLKNTAFWVFAGVAAKIVLGMIMALILYKNFKGKKLLTAVMLIPYAMPAAVSCTIWRLMYNPTFGHISQLMLDLGIVKKAVSFLGSMETSLLAVTIVNVWAVAPFCALNILSTLYSIPGYVYEAAEIDGANGLQKFFRITLPLILSDVRTLALLIGIWAFNSFDVIYMMTTGGPAGSSSILVNLVYENAFQFNNRGYSAAISVICFLILMVFAVLYVRAKGKEETSYE